MSNNNNDILEGFKMTELGLLPEEWESVSLGKIATINKVAIDPQSYPDESFEYYSIPAYQISNNPIIENGRNIHSQKLVVNTGTVLFGKLNPRVPKVWLVESLSDKRKLASTEFIPLVPIDRLMVSVFLYYLVGSNFVMPKAQELVSGSTPSRQRVDITAFNRISIPLPTLSEQKRIAKVLSTIQKAIETQDKIIAAAKELKKSLMHHLFTYGPVPAAQAEKVPLKETEIGPVPQDCEVMMIGEVADDLLGGGTPSTSQPDYWDGPIHWTTSKRINGIHISTGERGITQKGLDGSSTHLIPRGNLLIGTRVGVGKVAITDVDIAISQDLTGMFVDRGKYDLEFLAYEISSPRVQEYFRNLMRGTTIKGIPREDLKNIPLSIPSPTEQKEIAHILSSADEKIEAEEKRKVSLQALFKTMLHLLMTGIVRVKDLEVTAA